MCPHLFKALWCITLDLLNSNSLQERSDIRRLNISGNCLITVGGLFDLAWTYSGKSPGFLHGAYELFDRFSEMSRKSVVVKLTSVVMLNPFFLKMELIFLLNRSILGPVVFFTIANTYMYI